MSWTVLRVVEQGVILYEGHLRRVSANGEAFAAWALTAAPGVYGFDSVAHPRAASALRDGIRPAVAVSPVASLHGPRPKPRPPCPYDVVRALGMATLLTSADGSELFEAAAAALVGWDGARYVLAPADRPRVDSLSEAALRAVLPWVAAPLLLDGDLPLLLLNATGTFSLDLPGRRPFPEGARRDLDHLLLRSARRTIGVGT